MPDPTREAKRLALTAWFAARTEAQKTEAISRMRDLGMVGADFGSIAAPDLFADAAE
jgi:hypothetical protein